MEGELPLQPGQPCRSCRSAGLLSALDQKSRGRHWERSRRKEFGFPALSAFWSYPDEPQEALAGISPFSGWEFGSSAAGASCACAIPGAIPGIPVLGCQSCPEGGLGSLSRLALSWGHPRSLWVPQGWALQENPTGHQGTDHGAKASPESPGAAVASRTLRFWAHFSVVRHMKGHPGQQNQRSQVLLVPL